MTHDNARGEHGPYHWYQSNDGFLRRLLAAVPSIVVGHYVAITAFDSGSFRPDDDERKARWFITNDVAVSPRIGDSSAVPRAGEYDEWYVFSDVPQWGRAEVFVNYGGFDLRDPAQLAIGFDPTWDRAAEQAAADVLRGHQERFWTQMMKIRPDSYLAEGDKLICVTREQSLFVLLDKFFGL
jgi:hypothetical protein